MALTVTNVSGMLLLIRLRSGSTLRLRPGGRTGELADAEIRDNPRVDTLVERGLVRVDDVAAPPPAPAEPVESAETGKSRRGRSEPKASEGGSPG
jgi:hypothetical protein